MICKYYLPFCGLPFYLTDTGSAQNFKIFMKSSLSIFFFFLAAPCSMQDPSSPTGDWTHTPCSGSVESFNFLYIYEPIRIHEFLFSIIIFWLCWVFVAVHGLSLVVASRGCSSLWCAGFSLRWLLSLQSMGSRRVSSVVVVHGLGCSMACGIFLAQGSNPCPPHWQADS